MYDKSKLKERRSKKREPHEFLFFLPNRQNDKVKIQRGIIISLSLNRTGGKQRMSVFFCGFSLFFYRAAKRQTKEQMLGSES